MSVMPYRTILPTLGSNVFLASNAIVIGDVHIGDDSNVWFGCTVRGDVNTIRIGSRTNIQDGTIVHVTRQTGPTVIGNGVTIGHGAILHACTLMDNSFIGMGATVLDGAMVESGAWVAAGALVAPGKRILAGQIWAGNPARYLRDMTQAEKDFIAVSAQNYVDLAREYL